MDDLGIVLDKNVTSKHAPLFEVIHATEITLVIVGILLTVPLTWIVWNAKPLHKNLRIIFISCILQATAIFITRPALIYVQYCDFKDPPLFMPFAVLRIQSFVFYMVIMTGITVERLIATFYWEWYERQSTSTLSVVVGIFSAMTLFILWSTLEIMGVYRTHSIFALRKVGSPRAACITLISCVFYVLLLLFNKYELRRRHRNIANSYSLAHTYQLRENVVMMEMILRIMGPAFILCAPAFVIRGFYHFLPHTDEFAFYRNLAVGMFDLWISFVSAVMVFIFPLFNNRFRKPASRVFLYRQIVRCFDSRSSKEKIGAITDGTIADIYFESLNRALRKP